MPVKIKEVHKGVK